MAWTILLVDKLKIGADIGLLSTGYKVHIGYPFDKPWVLKFNSQQEVEEEVARMMRLRCGPRQQVASRYFLIPTEIPRKKSTEAKCVEHKRQESLPLDFDW